MLGDRTSRAARTGQCELSVSTLPWLADHVVNGVVIMPGAAYLDAALSAAASQDRASDRSALETGPVRRAR